MLINSMCIGMMTIGLVGISLYIKGRLKYSREFSKKPIAIIDKRDNKNENAEEILRKTKQLEDDFRIKSESFAKENDNLITKNSDLTTRLSKLEIEHAKKCYGIYFTAELEFLESAERITKFGFSKEAARLSQIAEKYKVHAQELKDKFKF